MKRTTFLACAFAAFFGLMSCDPAEKDGYEGTNYIYLSSNGSTTIFESATEPIVVDVMLTTAPKEAITLDFMVNDDNDVVRLEGNPVTVNAGEKTASFSIFSNNASKLTEAKVYKVTIADASALPEGVAMKGDFTFTVNPSTELVLTEEQKAIIGAYKENTGIDLMNWLGFVPVSAVYTASDPDSEIPHEPVTLTGKTFITLSEASTADKPVLKMTSNPMGVQDALYEKFRAITVKNPYWTDPDAYQSYSQLVEAIGWTAESEEIFTMSLDGIVLDGNSVEFIKDMSYHDEEYDEEVTLKKVPFEFSFTAYDRELKELEKGTIGTAVDEYWSEDATANPAYHINCEDVSEDSYELGNFVDASAVIANDKLEFTFCIYNYNDYDYSKVVATYTPNK